MRKLTAAIVEQLSPTASQRIQPTRSGHRVTERHDQSGQRIRVLWGVSALLNRRLARDPAEKTKSRLGTQVEKPSSATVLRGVSKLLNRGLARGPAEKTKSRLGTRIRNRMKREVRLRWEPWNWDAGKPRPFNGRTTRFGLCCSAERQSRNADAKSSSLETPLQRSTRPRSGLDHAGLSDGQLRQPTHSCSRPSSKSRGFRAGQLAICWRIRSPGRFHSRDLADSFPTLSRLPRQRESGERLSARLARTGSDQRRRALA